MPSVEELSFFKEWKGCLLLSTGPGLGNLGTIPGSASCVLGGLGQVPSPPCLCFPICKKEMMPVTSFWDLLIKSTVRDLSSGIFIILYMSEPGAWALSTALRPICYILKEDSLLASWLVFPGLLLILHMLFTDFQEAVGQLSFEFLPSCCLLDVQSPEVSSIQVTCIRL